MAKEVGVKIKISSEGSEVVVKNLIDLENELQKLQAQLKTQTFGSEEFNQTAAAIQNLKSKIEDVDKATEGLGVEKRFQAISASIGVAVSSFQALSGVVGLFASNSEDLEEIQKAEQQALQVLNIALGVNNALLQLNEASKLKDIIATKAQAIATKAAAAAQRLWNLALAANPIGLVIAGVAALTAAIVYFTSETEKSVDTIDELKVANEELNKITAESNKIRDEEIKKIAPLLSLIEQENLSREDRVKLVKQIQKDYPDYLKNANLEKITLGEIKDANDDLVESIIEVAQSRAAANEIAEIYAKRLEQTQRLEAVRIANEKEYQAFVKLDPSPSLLEGKRKQLEGYLLLAQSQIDKENETLNIREKVALSFLKEKKAVQDLTGGYKDNTKAVKENEDVFVKATRQRIELINKQIKAIEKLADVDLEYTANILEAQRKVLDDQDTFLKQRADALTTESERVLKGINDLLFKTIPSNEEIEKLYDGYAFFFAKIDEGIRSGELDLFEEGALGLDKLVEYAETKLPDIGKSLKNVGEKDLQSLINYFGTLKTRLQELNKIDLPETFTTFQLDIKPEQIDEYRKVEEQLIQIQRDRLKVGDDDIKAREKGIKVIQEGITILGYEKNILDTIYDINLEQFNLRTQNQTASEEQIKINNERIASLETEKNQLNALTESIYTSITANGEFIDGLREVGIQAEENAYKISELQNQINQPLSPEALDGVKEYFKGQADEFETILTDVFNRSQKYFNKLGKEGINALFEGLAEGLPEVEGQTRQELEKLSAYLQIVGDELADALGLEENPFVAYISQAREELKKLPTEAEEAFTKMVENLAEVAGVILQVFNDISSRIQNILQQQTSLLLEQLEYQQVQALNIIGEANTESAEENEKILAERNKVEKEYAKKRFEIEKQARVQELQFGIANAIAAGAQAVIQALGLPAPPPAPQIYAGFVGGLAAVQVALIREQLQFAQSKVFIGRRGGLINGATHEQGGVPAMLEGGEFVVSRPAVEQYGDIVSQLNASVGSRPLAIDDSRLVQAIAKQNTTKTPIKTYVLYNDIQSTDKLNKKIENLSKL